MVKIKYIKLIISFLCIIIVLLFNINYGNSHNNSKSISVNKNKKNKIDYTEIINSLKEEYDNKDIVGILKIDNELSVPLVQTSNNDYYLNHTVYNEKSNLGAIFLDYRIDINNNNKLLIYGHSSTKTNTEFNILENYYDKNYYDKHKYINLTTSKEEKIYEIFSVYIETIDFSYMNINFIDDNDYYAHIQNLKEKSLYDIGIELKNDDEILILQTCSNHENYKNYDKKYLLIISRRIK